MKIQVPLTIQIEVDTNDVERARRIAEECHAQMMEWYPLHVCDLCDRLLRKMPVITYMDVLTHCENIVILTEDT